jgi:hypothetical protein
MTMLATRSTRRAVIRRRCSCSATPPGSRTSAATRP